MSESNGHHDKSQNTKDTELDYNLVKLPHILRPKCSWTPPPDRNLDLDHVLNSIKEEVLKPQTFKKALPNLNAQERSGLDSLKKRTVNEIIIVPADKGESICVLSKEDYLNEGYRQLNDDRTYRAIDNNLSNRINKESDMIRKRFARKRLLENKMITKETFKAMRCKSVRPGRFYMLPKIHKLYHPGRPIVSCIGTPTKKISTFMDYVLSPFMSRN